MANKFSSGFNGVDKAIDFLRMGDNVVWQVDDLDDYAYYANCFLKSALKENKKLIYFRFGEHADIFQQKQGVIRHKIDPYEGFEGFAREIHRIIEKNGTGALYVFDSLSELLTIWATDLMIANFFYVTCPYLYELDTIAYFAVLRGRHSYKTIGKIRETTQVLIDLYRCQDQYYLHPIKVWKRFSPTMFLPHARKGEDFIPLTSSFETTNLFTHVCQIPADSIQRNLDYWEKMFLNAEEMLGRADAENQVQAIKDQIIRVMITKDSKMREMVRQYFSLRDLVQIKARLLGTGYIGGKSTGMLLARKILSMDTREDWMSLLEPHDSYYVGSDVFYTFIVQNHWWQEWMEHKTGNKYFEMGKILREKFLGGTFPAEIREKLMEMLEYFGQSPIIVRSSSLLEDSFGNAFAGKYKSFFCPNQGDAEDRYQNIIEAVKKIYASTMSDDALEYRQQRGLSEHDEQMSLLIQRVSGSFKKNYFFPDAAGVGVSYNTFVWNKEIDPRAGMLRMVAGMGTRAVDRVEGDYPAVIALDHPKLSPYPETSGEHSFTQQYVDGLNLQERRFETVRISRLLSENIMEDNGLIVQKNWRLSRKLSELGMKDQNVYQVNFEGLFEKTPFCRIMSNMLQALHSVYRYPVDIEFTVNLDKENRFHINLVQCRPLQTKEPGRSITWPENIANEKILFISTGNFMGGNIQRQIAWLVYVVPEEYSRLPEDMKYRLARLIGRVNKDIHSRGNNTIFLLGPGRWGSTTPAMGVPIHFAEIRYVAVLGEVSFQSGNLIPELSFGSHFFHDLVENNVFYVALFPEHESVIWRERFILERKNMLSDLFPEEGLFQDVLRVCCFESTPLTVISDLNSQNVMGYLPE